MIDNPYADAQRPADNENEAPTDAPGLTENDWEEIAAADLDPEASPANGDLRYDEEEPDGELPEEDDDNPFQESDAALPDEDEEKELLRNPSREGGRFED